MSQRVRTAVRVTGIVQGVGFRPFVYALATGLGLGGLVGNDVDGVFAEVEGSAAAVSQFLSLLEQQAPPLARIERITTKEITPNGSSEFSIAPSQHGGQRRTLVSADSAPCADCLAEFDDPADRRFRYPFINCTNCGPRFTIIEDVPYDRQMTTMARFALCSSCAAEYHDPADRRFHAQPVCCPACGPALRLIDAAGTELSGQRAAAVTGAHGPGADGPGADGPGADGPGADGPVVAAAALLRAGGILAVKGLGGYHLAADAGSEAAVAALRARKHREDKPFAVMVPDVAAARAICELDAAAQVLLTSGRRPIVLLPRQLPPAAAAGQIADAAGQIAASVAPGNRQLGVMLPYTPLHYLLLRAAGGPIVLTSGNISDEPIACDDSDALHRLGSIADAFLTHDRAIYVRTDDSVVRAFRGRAAVVRRSRGYVPEPLTVPVRFARQVLACGAELKNTFCLGTQDHAFVSHHIGDLENVATLRSFTDGIEHFARLFGIEPELVAYDLHPEYLSTKYAMELAGVELTGVQHHHAHIASCLADNGERGPVIGVAFDGTGYGSDGTIWGGEFLIADLVSFERAGYLAPVPMPGGTAAIRQPWRMAAAYLAAAYQAGPPDGLAVIRRAGRRWAEVLAVASAGINSPLTSSAGRLFDAAAAILGVRDAISYEGQAAVELEQLADPAERGTYPARIEPAVTCGAAGAEGAGAAGAEPLRVAGADLIRAVCEDAAAGVDRSIIAARFHNGVAAVIEQACVQLRERHGLSTVALTGGVFQNLLLLDRVVGRLEQRRFGVLLHSRVPCNDGGISLGQAVVAAARDQLTKI